MDWNLKITTAVLVNYKFNIIIITDNDACTVLTKFSDLCREVIGWDTAFTRFFL